MLIILMAGRARSYDSAASSVRLTTIDLPILAADSLRGRHPTQCGLRKVGLVCGNAHKAQSTQRYVIEDSAGSY